MATSLPGQKKKKDDAVLGAVPQLPINGGALPTQVVTPSFMDKVSAGPRAFGGLPNTPDVGSPMALADAAGLQNTFGAGSVNTAVPQLPVAGTASPDINPLPVGTRLGAGVRDIRQAVGNAQATAANAAGQYYAGGVNAVTAIPRAVGGVLRDAGRAVVGLPASPNAGQPIGGLVAPTIGQPYPNKPIDFIQPPAAPGTTAGAGASGPGIATTADNISARNLAAANNFGNTALPRPDLSGVRGSVSSTALTAPVVDSGVNVNGRRLNYGAMVNGVPTFSDGTGGVPQTIGKAGMAQLAQERSISNPGTGYRALASDTNGGATQTQEQMVSRAVSQLQQPSTGFRPSAQMYADADRLAIASKDPRSAAGIAARNLSIDAQYGGNKNSRAAAAASLAQLTAGQQQAGLAAQQADAEFTNTNQRGSNALQQIAAQGQNELATENLRGQYGLQAPQAGQLVTDAGGNYSVVNTRTGVSTATRDANGNPLRAPVTKDDATTKRTNELNDNLATATNNLLIQWQKNQLQNADGSQNKPDIPALREQAARAMNFRIGKDEKGNKIALINGQETLL